MVAAAVLLIASGDGSDAGGQAAGGRAARSIVTPPRIYPYPAAAVRRFVAECVRSAPDERRTCRCVVDDLQTRLPYREFAAADRATRGGRPLPARARRAFVAATRFCRATA